MSRISSRIVLPILAGDGGVEPPLADSKSAVLPLDESPIFVLRLLTSLFTAVCCAGEYKIYGIKVIPLILPVCAF